MTILRNPSGTGVSDGMPLAARPRRSGFSLIEIMIVVGLLSVIILGLMGMFSETQRAFRLGMSQTDVLEAGRIATDLIVRELAQITPGNRPAGLTSNARNFYSGPVPYPDYAPLVQPLPGGPANRVNLLDDMFFVERENETWTGIGYCVRTSPGFSTGTWGPAGTLYRFETKASEQNFDSGASILIRSFFLSTTNVSRVLDGVVHFRVNTYDRDGRLLTPNSLTNFPPSATNNIVFQASVVPGNPIVYFQSNAVPAFVEVELGILEPQIYDRYRAIPIASAQAQFLKKQAGRVHIFRQRVAVRNLDPSAYP